MTEFCLVDVTFERLSLVVDDLYVLAEVETLL